MKRLIFLGAVFALASCMPVQTSQSFAVTFQAIKPQLISALIQMGAQYSPGLAMPTFTPTFSDNNVLVIRSEFRNSAGFAFQEVRFFFEEMSLDTTRVTANTTSQTNDMFVRSSIEE